MIAVALVPFLVALFATLNVATKTFEEQVSAQLDSLRDSKYKELHAYLAQIEDQVSTLAESDMTVRAALQFTEAFRSMPEELRLTSTDISAFRKSVQNIYEKSFEKRYQMRNGHSSNPSTLVPKDQIGLVAQHQYIVGKP